MEIGLWIAVLIIIGLSYKLYLMRKSAKEIAQEFTERLQSDTNTLIDIASRDGQMRNLANVINIQLRDLRRQRQRYQQGDQELKEAITNLSHDLRTPLTAICGYLELMEAEELTESSRRHLAMIRNRTELMKQLCEELFRYSIIVSVQEEQKEWLDLKSLLEESLVSFYGALKQKEITPEIIMPAQSMERYLDRSAVSRIFSNIIGNAVKYSDGDLTVTMHSDGSILFCNHAGGLDPVTVGRLFERFYTVESGRNSTGLGLAIARLLTERMGGTIEAEYKEGELRLRIMFPEP